jgi:hypothetical protein
MTRDWTAGGVFVLRHAGLPFDLMEEFTAPAGLLSAADALLDAEEALIATAVHAGVPEARVRAAVTAAEPGQLPAHSDPDWQNAASRWRERLLAFDESFVVEEERAWSALRLVLRRADVQEAIFLSNPEVYRNMLVPFLDGPRPRNARWRRASRQLYTYVQRLCAKNETVSFFGPMAYGTVRPGYGAALRTAVPRRRRVYFAYWAAREVADAVARDRRLRSVLPFRHTGAHPGNGDGGPGSGQPELAGVLAAVRRAGPEGASLARIAAAMPAAPRDIAPRLQSLVADRRLEFGIAPAPYETDPLGAMLRRLAGIGGAAAREWSGKLSKLRELLAELERTAFPGRIACVERLEQEFSAVTGKPARRGAGAVYADRAVFYEECASPFALEVGEQTLRSWINQVSASLEVSVAHGAATQQKAAEEARTALGAVTTLRFDDYAARLLTALEPGGSQFVPAHVPSYPVTESKRVTEDLLGAAARLPGDRYALIDLCLAATGTGQLPAAAVVLSRCHHHLLTDGWLGEMYTGTEPFGAAAAAWIAGHPGLVGMDAGRRNKGYYLFPGRRVVLRAPSAADADDPMVIWPTQITVVQTAAGPRCLDEAGRPASLYLPLSDVVNYPPYAALSHPQVLHAVFTAPPEAAGTADTPEVIVDEAVYQRPRWRIAATELSGGTPRARFLQLRRLARTRIPGRFVFCRTDAERKPYLVDLASVLAADLAAHIAKGGAAVTAEQMRPAPDELWLRDEHGHRYTCELRMQVTGRERDRPAGREETA